MKVLIVDHYYDEFLNDFYARHAEVDELDYESHRASLMDECYGAGDAYSHFLGEAGVEAEEIVTNDARLQLKWARAHGIKVIRTFPRRVTKVLNRLFQFDWRFGIIREQIKERKPDVLLIQEQSILTDGFVNEIKAHVPMVVIQVASPLPKRRSYKGVDLVLSSFPHYVDLFRQKGMKAEFLGLCFDSRLLTAVKEVERDIPLTFIGGVSPKHSRRLEMLENLASNFPLKWYGYGRESVSRNSPLWNCYAGCLSGLAMYRVLARSQLTVNCHIDEAKGYVNNMRLFEATGMGSCVVTDQGKNLGDYFDEKRRPRHSTRPSAKRGVIHSPVHRLPRGAHRNRLETRRNNDLQLKLS